MVMWDRKREEKNNLSPFAPWEPAMRASAISVGELARMAGSYSLFRTRVAASVI